MPESIVCPLCDLSGTKPINSRLHKCGNCKVIINSRFASEIYEDDYFLGQYKKQYGKTYHEDFKSIYTQSVRRLSFILKLIDNKKKHADIKLLDIGSAMGFFLKAARDLGIGYVLGNEISKFGSNHCIEEFGIECINSSYIDFETAVSFDIITAWYVIEHSESPLEIIKKIYTMLNNGGILGMAVPSFFGPQYNFNRNQWLDSFPNDHRIELSPSIIKKILREAGFKKIFIKPGGFHPERVISKDSVFFRLFSFWYKLFSRISGFSDTIEIYAVK